ncbi:zinc-dependent metalloprotease [Namhaeicola litoreus]|uniref:Zinc-dependent metalloprotease n=1 Tax=Namhaeicola litoreus TaxID=1052145 RepID=A0ABW3Y329_9FLAO
MHNIKLFLYYLLSIGILTAQSSGDQKKQFQGFFDFQYNENDDQVLLTIKEDQFEKEFLYVSALAQGLGSNDIGLDRGQLGGGVLVKWIRKGNKVLLSQPNLNYRAISQNEAERNSVEEAFAKSVLFGTTVLEEREEDVIIDLTEFIIRDAHGVADRLESNKQGSYSLDKSRSAINLERTKAFPKNVEFESMITLKGKPKSYEIRSVSPDAEAITVFQHHSFVELPDNNYKPRKYEPRCGSWDISYFDYATPINEPINQMFITRHRLEKKNPNSTISEAVEPIIYYVDRGAPELIKNALIEGASWWNQAFEAIGYKNAFQVKVLPEGVDPLDLRYNVIQWVHRSTRGWSYGGSIVDPRTGEIIKGHVSLGSLRVRQDYLIAQGLQAPFGNGTNDDFAMEMALARIRQLSAHEVGHTLGFAHNFAASTNNRSSVMDYPHPWIKVKNNQLDFTEAYASGIGDWDKVTVAYAYQSFENNEEGQLQKILEDAFENGFRYISDSDARPQGSAHGYAHLWDNGSDPVYELKNVLEVRKIAIDRFSLDNIRDGQPYSLLEDVFVPVYFYHRYQTEAVAKMIGGMDYSYAVKNNQQERTVFLPTATQVKALQEILKTINVEEMGIPKKLLELFPPRAMGFNRNRETFKSNVGLAFDPYGAMATNAHFTFSLLLHPERINRLILQKSLDENQVGLGDVIDEVINESFKKRFNPGYENELQNIVNTVFLEELFSLSTNEDLYIGARSIVNQKIGEISRILGNTKTKGDQAEVYKEFQRMINQYQKDPSKYIKTEIPKIPDGSPIGSFE